MWCNCFRMQWHTVKTIYALLARFFIKMSFHTSRFSTICRINCRQRRCRVSGRSFPTSLTDIRDSSVTSLTNFDSLKVRSQITWRTEIESNWLLGTWKRSNVSCVTSMTSLEMCRHLGENLELVRYKIMAELLCCAKDCIAEINLISNAAFL